MQSGPAVPGLCPAELPYHFSALLAQCRQRFSSERALGSGPWSWLRKMVWASLVCPQNFVVCQCISSYLKKDFWKKDREIFVKHLKWTQESNCAMPSRAWWERTYFWIYIFVHILISDNWLKWPLCLFKWHCAVRFGLDESLNVEGFALYFCCWKPLKE